MTLMSIKNKLDQTVSIIIRFIIGLSVFILLSALILLVNWFIETLGGQVIFGGILLIIAVIGCYGVGCSICPHKEKGEK